jgi:hypothetical protein
VYDVMWVMLVNTEEPDQKKPLILTPVVMRGLDSSRGHDSQAHVEAEKYYGTEGQAEEIERENGVLEELRRRGLINSHKGHRLGFVSHRKAKKAKHSISGSHMKMHSNKAVWM